MPMLPRAPRRVGAFALVALALVALAGAAEAGPLQDLIDGAAPGSTVHLPPGRFEERLRIAKPLTVIGAAAGTEVVGGAAPAVVVTAGPVRLDGLSVSSADAPLAMAGASLVEVWNMSGAVTLRATDVGWVRVATAPDAPVPIVEGANASAVWGHLVDVRIAYADGSPWPGASVRLMDGERVALDAVADADGALRWVFVAHAWERHGPAGVERGTNVTEVRVAGSGVRVQVDAHVGVLAVRTDVPPPRPGDATTLAAAVAVLGAACVALGFRFHDGFRWRWLLLLAPLYTRLARDEILENGTREALYGHIEAHPGAHLRGLKEELGLHHGTLLHHLQVLEQQRYVKSVRDGMYRRYYVTGAAPRVEGADPTAEEVHRRVVAAPGITNREIADALGKRPSLIHYHLARLEERGRVRREREGRVVRVFPAEASQGPERNGPERDA